MKKLILLTMLLVGFTLPIMAQNDTTVYVVNVPNGEALWICEGSYDRVVYYGPSSSYHEWGVNYGQGATQYFYEDHIALDIVPSREYCITYRNGEDFQWWGYLICAPIITPNPTTQIIWKRQGQPIALQPVGNDSIEWFSYQWNTGSTDPIIEVVNDSTYTCEISYYCGSSVRTFIVRDNVELYRATVDLATNLNKVTWHTTESQAEYISEVKVERDGMVVGTAPYEDGQFIDNIGSENAARNYRLTAITTEGDECPIPSYQYGTLHVDYSPNASNPNKLNMAWTPPFIEEGAPYSVGYFRICKYDPETNEVTVVDQIAANITIGSYDVSLFDGGYATVAAMFNEGKDYEELSFSNLTDFLLGIEENEGQQCRVYPNPANDRFTVEGTGMMRITNVLGQEIIAKEIDGKETVALPKGLYFVQLNGAVQKVVVE